jgi:hypothetical protein
MKGARATRVGAVFAPTRVLARVRLQSQIRKRTSSTVQRQNIICSMDLFEYQAISQGGYAPSGTSPGRSGPFGAVRLT